MHIHPTPSVSVFTRIKTWTRKTSSLAGTPKNPALIKAASLQQKRYLFDIFNQRNLPQISLSESKRFPLLTTPLQRLRAQVVLPFLTRILKSPQKEFLFNQQKIALPIIRNSLTMARLNFTKEERKELNRIKQWIQYAIPDNYQFKKDVAEIMQTQLLSSITGNSGQSKKNPLKAALAENIQVFLDTIRAGKIQNPESVELSTIENAVACSIRDNFFDKMTDVAQRNPKVALELDNSPISGSIIKAIWQQAAHQEDEGLDKEVARIAALKSVLHILETHPESIIPQNRENYQT